MNQLLNELGIRKDSIASSMIDKIKQKETIELLQSYDISILKELNKTLNQEANDLYQKVHKRRMAYVEKVRKHSNGQSGFIDLNSDQDDTANLSCGITAIYNVMDKIDKIIVKKMNVINEQKNKNYMCNTITTVLIALPILYVFL
jgi:FtsZ-binding cell division protein ZapB